MTADATRYHQQRLNNMRGLPLTGSEQRIIALVAAGTTDTGIAAHLGTNVDSVKWALREIRAKLNATGRANAVHRAWQTGYLGGNQ